MKRSIINRITLLYKATGISLVVLLTIPWGVLHAQDDPFVRLQRMANPQDTVKKELSKITITTANPVWKANTRPRIANTPIPMKDKSGRVIPPNEIITLKNGVKMTAAQFFSQLNDLERKLNAQGYSLRNKETVVVSQLVVPTAEMNRKAATLQSSTGPLKSEKEIQQFLLPEAKADNLLLKPLGQYSSVERKKIQESVVEKQGNTLKVKPLLMARPLPGTPRVLRTINQTSSKDWNLGRVDVMQAGVKVSLTRYAKLYQFNPASPGTNRSELRVTGTGKIYGSVLRHTLNIASGYADFYAPQDSSKKITAKVVISVLGMTILNINQQYTQYHNISGSRSRNIDESFRVDVPIVAGIVVHGELGIKGNVGFEYSATQDRLFVSGTLRPIADIAGYAEVGVGLPGGLASVGVGGSLTFVRGYVELQAYLGIFNQNASQIVLGYGYYAGYNVAMLKGRLYFYAEVCVPDWVPFVGGDCARYTHTIFEWNGFNQSGTIAADSDVIVIANI